MNIPLDILEEKTYGCLYKHLALQGNKIPLGLLHAAGGVGPKGNKSPYVYTNPDMDTEIYFCDKVFVLSMTPERVESKVDIKVSDSDVVVVIAFIVVIFFVLYDCVCVVVVVVVVLFLLLLLLFKILLQLLLLGW